jgi:protein tyrosine phosphatase (PTP) superfamily phosphohydrolase (DUF442 family)
MMRLNHLLHLALVTVALAGCGQTAVTSALSTGRATGATEAMALPDSWTDLSKLSTPDDPADLPGAPAFTPGPNPVPGIDIVRFSKVDDHFYRGGLPSKADLVALKKLGIKTDIDLMGEVPVFDSAMVLREKMWAKSAGVNFVQVKVPTGTVPFGKKITPAVAEQFLKVALDPANQPVFIHCLHGRDRTGTMSAVYRMTANGFTNDQAWAEMKSFGFDEKEYPTLAAFVKAYKATPAVAN